MKKKLLALAAIMGAVVVAIVILLAGIIYGRTTIRQGSEGYREFAGEGLSSPLVVFPRKDLESVSEEYYYEFRDEIFSPVCQIYLRREYQPEEFAKEVDRLDSTQLTYADETNRLYLDRDNFSAEAYVALANWTDRYEYALIMEESNTIVYVYLENMTRANLEMDEAYLPAYFKDRDVSDSSAEEMTAECRSYYAFKLGSKYIDCMDLAKPQHAVG